MIKTGELAKKLGVTPQTVRNTAKRLGLEPRMVGNSGAWTGEQALAIEAATIQLSQNSQNMPLQNLQSEMQKVLHLGELAAKDELIEMLKTQKEKDEKRHEEQISLLQEELRVKNEQIMFLQNTATAAQALHAGTMQKQLPDGSGAEPPPTTVETWEEPEGIWARFLYIVRGY